MLITKMNEVTEFYDNLISSGTKIIRKEILICIKFYDNLISSGTKIQV